MKREGALKSAFTSELRRQYPSWVSMLLLTAGAPDRAIVGAGVTTWWEFKHGTPDYESPGLQELQCMRIAKQGACFYVLWLEDRHGRNKHTLIVTPNTVHHRDEYEDLPVIARGEGHDMKWLVAQVARMHGLT